MRMIMKKEECCETHKLFVAERHLILLMRFGSKKFSPPNAHPLLNSNYFSFTYYTQYNKF